MHTEQELISGAKKHTYPVILLPQQQNRLNNLHCYKRMVIEVKNCDFKCQNGFSHLCIVKKGIGLRLFYYQVST